MGSSGDDGYRLLNEYTNGFMVSQVLFAACELGVFDLLAEAPGPLDVAAVAAGVEASSHGTELLLDTCVSLKLLKVETRAGKAFYENTELSSAYLTRVSPTSQCSLLKYMGRTSYGCWGHLADAVREGKNQYLQTFGIPAEDLLQPSTGLRASGCSSCKLCRRSGASTGEACSLPLTFRGSHLCATSVVALELWRRSACLCILDVRSPFSTSQKWCGRQSSTSHSRRNKTFSSRKGISLKTLFRKQICTSWPGSSMTGQMESAHTCWRGSTILASQVVAFW